MPTRLSPADRQSAPDPAPISRLLTVREFSALFGWSTRKTRDLAAAGRIQVLRFGRRTVRIAESEAARLLASAQEPQP